MMIPSHIHTWKPYSYEHFSYSPTFQKQHSTSLCIPMLNIMHQVMNLLCLYGVVCDHCVMFKSVLRPRANKCVCHVLDAQIEQPQHMGYQSKENNKMSILLILYNIKTFI